MMNHHLEGNGAFYETLLSGFVRKSVFRRSGPSPLTPGLESRYTGILGNAGMIGKQDVIGGCKPSGARVDGVCVMLRKEEWRLNEVLGQRIKELRLVQGLSLTDLAQGIGITYQQLQKIEQGVNRVSATRLFLIAEFLEMPVNWFYEELRKEN